jgi:LSD1 subclass zinc finger protein
VVTLESVLQVSLPNPLPDVFTPNPEETVKVVAASRVFLVGKFTGCWFLLTTERIMVVNNSTKYVIFDLPLKMVKLVGLDHNVLVGHELRTTLKLGYSKWTYLIDLVKTSPDGVSVELLRELIIKLRNEKTLGPKVGTMLDFAWLSKIIKQESLSIRPIKCPSCGAPLDMPSSGRYVKCSHCGVVVQVTDIIDLIKDQGI